MVEHIVIADITRDIGDYIRNNIEEIRSDHPEFRKIMRNISREMTDNLKDQGRVEIGTKGNEVANNNGKKARRDVRKLTDNEVVLKDRVRSLEFIKDELTDDNDRLGVMLSDMSIRVDRQDDTIAGLRDQKLRENSR